MDQRKIQLKEWKKAYKRAKCRATWYWKLLFAFSFLCAIVLLAVKFFADKFAGYLPGFVKVFLAQSWSSLAIWGAVGVMGLLLLLSVIRWAVKKKRLKKHEAFLNYRTMRYALKAEKELQK